MEEEEAKSAAIPRLRFPEFRESGPWDVRKLSDLLQERKQRNRDLKFGPSQVLSVSGDHGCVNQIELLGRSYAGASVKEYHVVETGDLVYTKSPLKKNPYGIIKENKGKPGIVSTLYAVYRATELGHPAYLDHYFSRDYNLNSYLQPIVRKGAKNDMKVNNSAVLSGEVLAPKTLEQQQISDCLTSLDDLIAAQGRKVDALKTYKRGLMQQLFPREGETLPRLRFPEFRNAPDWAEREIGDICEILNSRRIPISSSDRKAGPYPYYGASGIVDFVDSFIFDERLLLVGEDGAKWGAFERTAFIVEDKCWVNNHAHVLKCVGVNDTLLESYLTMADIGAYITGNAPPKLTLGKLKSISVPIPESEAEQQRIGSYLSAFDALIAVEAEKLLALKTHKKGLMQQLFASPGGSYSP